MENNKNLNCIGKDIKETPFHNDKDSSHQEDITILIVHAEKNRAKYMKSKLTIMNREIDKSTNIVEYVNTPLSRYR